jgi:hypothetical protein
MDSRQRMPSPGPTPAPSAALIMEEPPKVFLHADSPASVEVFTAEEASTAAAAVTGAAVTGDSVQLYKTQLMIWRKKSCTQTI